MTYILLILFSATVILASIFNITSAVKRQRKASVVINLILYGIFGLLLVFNKATEAQLLRDSRDYKIYQSGILGSLDYVRTENGYHIIRETALLASPVHIAIPEENADVPAISRIYTPVNIYCEKGTVPVQDDSGRYMLGDTVVYIKPAFAELILVTGAIDVLIIAVFNYAACVVNLVKRRRNS